MNDPGASRLPAILGKKFAGYRHRWRLVSALRGTFLALAVLGGSVGVAVAADRLFRLPTSFRLALLVGVAVSVCFCLVRWMLWPMVRRLRDRDVALRLGKSFPEMEEDLVTAVELSSERKNGQGISHELVGLALKQIGLRATKVEQARAVSLRPLIETAAVLFAVVVLFQCAYMFRPDAVFNALNRLFYPNEAVEFFTYTRLHVVPGDTVVRSGDAASIEAIIWGRPVRLARLDARGKSGDSWVDLQCNKGRATWQSEALFDDLRYRVKAGDARTDWHQVRVLPAPSLLSKSGILRIPEYAGSNEEIIDDIQGRLDIIEGSSLVIQVEPVKRGEATEFRCDGELFVNGESVCLNSNGANVLVSERFTPTESGECRIRLVDGFGLENRSPESIHVEVLPDLVPKVSVKKPGRDVALLPGESIRIQIEATDELGLREVGLRHRAIVAEDNKNKHVRWQDRNLQAGGIQVRQISVATDLDVDALGLRPGDVLEYIGSASDYAEEAVLRRGTSPVYRLTVIGEIEHLDRMMSKLQMLQVKLLRLAAEQSSEAKKVDEIAEASEKTTQNEQAKRAKTREQDLARSAEALARDVESTIPDFSRNRLASANLLSGLERLGRGVRSVSSGEMQEASRSLGDASEQTAPDQQDSLRRAHTNETEAAHRLRQLARELEKLQRQGILAALAAKAEKLAARQREVRSMCVDFGRKTAGGSREQLSGQQNEALDGLVESESSIETGVNSLFLEIEEAESKLSFTKPAAAALAAEAREKMDTDKVADTVAEIVRRMNENMLFSQLQVQDYVASSLDEVASILRRQMDSEELEMIAKEIDEFIRRQEEINAGIVSAIEKSYVLRPTDLASEQGDLKRDVSEQASALYWLSQEILGFKSETADRLDAAATEMGLGTGDLYASVFSQALEHGEKALELLKESQSKFESERSQMASACQARGSLEAALLLQRILVGQKRLNKQTATADQERASSVDFVTTSMRLARKQNDLRLDANRLRYMLRWMRGAAAIVDKSSQKMNISRMALQAGDTGKQTRIVQRQIAALLETLLCNAKSCMGGCCGGKRMMALMNMLCSPGMNPGGFMGGTNANILPSGLEDMTDPEWHKVRTRFDEELAAGFEEEYPLEFRSLLNAYFERLRSEPTR